MNYIVNALNKKYVFIAIFTLRLCAGCTPSPGIIQTREVDVPIVISCAVNKAPEPDWNLPKLSQAANSFDRLKSALADLELSKGYIGALKAELSGCG